MASGEDGSSQAGRAGQARQDWDVRRAGWRVTRVIEFLCSLFPQRWEAARPGAALPCTPARHEIRSQKRFCILAKTLIIEDWTTSNSWTLIWHDTFYKRLDWRPFLSRGPNWRSSSSLVVAPPGLSSSVLPVTAVLFSAAIIMKWLTLHSEEMNGAAGRDLPFSAAVFCFGADRLGARLDWLLTFYIVAILTVSLVSPLLPILVITKPLWPQHVVSCSFRSMLRLDFCLHATVLLECYSRVWKVWQRTEVCSGEWSQSVWPSVEHNNLWLLMQRISLIMIRIRIYRQPASRSQPQHHGDGTLLESSCQLSLSNWYCHRSTKAGGFSCHHTAWWTAEEKIWKAAGSTIFSPSVLFLSLVSPLKNWLRCDK